MYQYATATGDGGNASASFVNNGSFNVAAAANALGGGDVYADAYARAASQYAFGGSEGTASVSFDNNAPLNVSAYATGLGGGDGTASAFATGIYQQAGAGGGATASVYNTKRDRGLRHRRCDRRQRGAPGILRPGHRRRAWRLAARRLAARHRPYVDSTVFTDAFGAGA